MSYKYPKEKRKIHAYTSSDIMCNGGFITTSDHLDATIVLVFHDLILRGLQAQEKGLRRINPQG